jgi:hypothetical protein
MLTVSSFLSALQIDNGTHDQILAAINERDGTPIETPDTNDAKETPTVTLVT